MVALTHDRDPFDRFVAYYLGPPLFLAPSARFAWAAIRHRTLRAAQGGKNLGSFPAIIVALSIGRDSSDHPALGSEGSLSSSRAPSVAKSWTGRRGDRLRQPGPSAAYGSGWLPDLRSV